MTDFSSPTNKNSKHEEEENKDEEDDYKVFLVALFASRLDTLDKEPSIWKHQTIQKCYPDNSKVTGYLKPWLDGRIIELNSAPLLAWFSNRNMMNSLDEKRKRVNEMRNLLGCVVNDGFYDARARVGLKLICKDLKLDWETDLAPFENYLAIEFSKVYEQQQQQQQDKEEEEKTSNWSYSRMAKVGGASIIGGGLLAFTGGAAALLFAPLAGAIFATSTTVGIGVVTGLFGVAGAGLSGYKMADRTSNELYEFFFTKVPREEEEDDNQQETSVNTVPKSLHLIIGISGSMQTENLPPIKKYWYEVFKYELTEEKIHGRSDLYTLIYDRKPIVAYSVTVADMIKDQALQYAYNEVLKFVIGHTIMAAISLPMTVSDAFNIINNSFVLCETRSVSAGRELALALKSKIQGNRPVSLVGFGFGALTIFSCLEELAKQNLYGIVEDVILCGTPLRAEKSRWENSRKVVAGKYFNCYCLEDWTLKIIMRYSFSNFPVAGLSPVDCQNICNREVFVDHFSWGSDYGKNMSALVQSCLFEEME